MVSEKRLRKKVMSKHRLGFMPERNKIDAIFALHPLMEKYGVEQIDLHY